MSHEFGEGALRMNKATIYLVKQARWAQRHWGLSEKALVQCLRRVMVAEHHTEPLMNYDTLHALKPVDEEKAG